MVVSWLSAPSANQSCHSVGVDWDIETLVGCGHTTVHISNIPLRDVRDLGDPGHLLRLQIAIVESAHFVLQAAQIEERFLLRWKLDTGIDNLIPPEASRATPIVRESKRPSVRGAPCTSRSPGW
jgi:hypothetical protein